MYLGICSHIPTSLPYIGKKKGCPRCGGEEESINHPFFDCPPSRKIWALSPIPTSGHLFPRSSLFYNFDFLFWWGREFWIGEEALEIFPWILWYIWKIRNRIIFENLREPPQETLDIAIQEANFWKQANFRDLISEEHSVAHVNSPLSFPLIIECKVYASWHSDDSYEL